MVATAYRLPFRQSAPSAADRFRCQTATLPQAARAWGSTWNAASVLPSPATPHHCPRPGHKASPHPHPHRKTPLILPAPRCTHRSMVQACPKGLNVAAFVTKRSGQAGSVQSGTHPALARISTPRSMSARHPASPGPMVTHRLYSATHPGEHGPVGGGGAGSAPIVQKASQMSLRGPTLRSISLRHVASPGPWMRQFWYSAMQPDEHAPTGGGGAISPIRQKGAHCWPSGPAPRSISPRHAASPGP